MIDCLHINLFVRKNSHKKRIKSAKKVLKLINTAKTLDKPEKIFAYLRKVDPFVFEELLLLAFKKRGFKVIRNHRYTGDGGIDGMVVLPSKQKIAIQAKRYQNYINIQHVQRFYYDLYYKGCAGGYFIHCGKTGKGVYQDMPKTIKLISGQKLIDLLRYKPCI